ncbi:MAG TPA: hypothetical protein VHF51_00360 [Solirubrobacteraceae bacterium]|nr:hypothetical protein [Solirubrobacteraceae bacterium]
MPGSRLPAAAVTGGLAAALVAGCGSTAPDRGVLRHSGVWYRAQPEEARTRVAAACRAEAAASARGAGAREQLRAIELDTLRDAIDDAETIIARQRRPLADVCRAVVPFHTPGLDVRFGNGARHDGDGTWSVPAISTRPYMIRGRIAPARAGTRLVARRMDGYTVRAVTDAGGAFALRVRFRRVADNTFTVSIDAPAAAPRKVLFTAICLDCLAGSPTPPPS